MGVAWKPSQATNAMAAAMLQLKEEPKVGGTQDSGLPP